ncbi:hypothetical protein HRM2_48010 [Desulforapulum autotrophicum HRM2]|uniref:Uncharacterized protein n=1 Tax=Desulforapulum autotrophicum (strain ATCC 43914 / DSM 3382 / VKM B-1955 / HRM2) TaxID=177437 RepID=C0QHJ1_DESAH|nr:hypothetical protein [Desulforapulum autotrophicum]ACN17850.1 hypothetical protein HRM2_48010 [Desulforapulum autotrophicum HRM2]
MKKKSEAIEAPAHLSESAESIWLEYAGTIIKSPARLALFQSGLEAMDRAKQARQLVAKEGMIQKTERSGVSHAHPGLKIEKESQAAMLKAFKLLGIQHDHIWSGSIY